jgi:hypothetical protein
VHPCTHACYNKYLHSYSLPGTGLGGRRIESRTKLRVCPCGPLS